MHDGIPRQFQLHDRLDKLRLRIGIVFPDKNHRQPRAESIADAICLRQDLMEARGEGSGDGDGFVWDLSHHRKQTFNAQR